MGWQVLDREWAYYGTHIPAILSDLQTLRICEIDAVFRTEQVINRTIHLVHLRSLILHSVFLDQLDSLASQIAVSGETERLLTMFNVPSLTSLTITGKLWDTRPLIDCLHRSSCSLQSLAIPFVDSDSIYAVLRCTPNLQHLKVTFPWMIDFKFLSKVLKIDVSSTAHMGVCFTLENLTVEYGFRSTEGLDMDHVPNDARMCAKDMQSRQARMIANGANGRFIFSMDPDSPSFAETLRDCLTKESKDIMKNLEFVCVPRLF